MARKSRSERQEPAPPPDAYEAVAPAESQTPDVSSQKSEETDPRTSDAPTSDPLTSETLTSEPAGPVTCDVVIGAHPVALGHGTRQPGERIGKVTLTDGEPEMIVDGNPDELKNALANRKKIKLVSCES